MCEFISWKEHQGKNYFLTNADLDTKEGKKLLLTEVKADLCGHGAIESFYPELKGKGENKECTDFSSPDNFPPDIVDAIKKGKLSSIGICLDVLNDNGKSKYKEIERPAYAKYEKIKQQAYAKYLEINEEIEQSAWAKYKEIEQSAYSKYLEIEQRAFSEIISQKKYRKEEWK
jgi:hypothetical protein